MFLIVPLKKPGRVNEPLQGKACLYVIPIKVKDRSRLLFSLIEGARKQDDSSRIDEDSISKTTPVPPRTDLSNTESGIPTSDKTRDG